MKKVFNIIKASIVMILVAIRDMLCFLADVIGDQFRNDPSVMGSAFRVHEDRRREKESIHHTHSEDLYTAEPGYNFEDFDKRNY